MGLAFLRGTDIGYSELLAPLIWETDPELFEFLFQGDKVAWSRLFAPEWMAADGLHAAVNATVAIENDTVAGLLICFPSATMEARADASFRRYLDLLDEAAATHLAWAAAQMAWLFPPAPRDSLMIFNLAVNASHRGRGLGKSLVKRAEENARTQGFASIHLDTASTSAAVDFYLGNGFSPVVETCLRGADTRGRLPGHLRMVKEVRT